MAAWLAIRIVLAFKARIEEQLLLAQFSRVRRVPKQHETVRPISVLNPLRIGPLKVLRHHVDEPRHSTRRSLRAERGARLAAGHPHEPQPRRSSRSDRRHATRKPGRNVVRSAAVRRNRFRGGLNCSFRRSRKCTSWPLNQLETSSEFVPMLDQKLLQVERRRRNQFLTIQPGMRQ